jgi:hypothetical protein
VARTHRLLALLAPGSIEAEVGALQQAVFSEHGFVSAIALPPLVPVRFLPLDASLRLPMAPGSAVAAGFMVMITGQAWSSGGVWPALRGDERWSDGPWIFPCFEGFYLGCAESEPVSRAAVRVPAVDRRFSSLDIAVMSITVLEDGPDWWREVHWQIEDRRPLRGKRTSSPGGPNAGRTG